MVKLIRLVKCNTVHQVSDLDWFWNGPEAHNSRPASCRVQCSVHWPMSMDFNQELDRRKMGDFLWTGGNRKLVTNVTNRQKQLIGKIRSVPLHLDSGKMLSLMKMLLAKLLPEMMRSRCQYFADVSTPIFSALLPELSSLGWLCSLI